MPFKIRREAQDWFQSIRPDLDREWDSYYFCLLAGLSLKKRAPKANDTDSKTVYEKFPSEYLDKSNLIIGLFTSVELDLMGIDLKDKKQTHKFISTLIDPRSATGLSSDGLNLMNRYADYGFDVLCDWFEDRPRTLEAFLPKFKSKIEEFSKL